IAVTLKDGKDPQSKITEVLREREATRRQTQRSGNQIIQYAESKLTAGTQDFVKLHKLLENLCQRLNEPYAFTIYAAKGRECSVNYGVLTTYRQKWEPLNYQPGELVKTIPLAPKESRKFTKKVLLKKRRS